MVTTANIHSTAIIADTVSFEEDVTVGAYAILTGNITVGRGCRIDAHAVLEGDIELGPGCVVESQARIEGQVTLAEEVVLKSSCKLVGSPQVYIGKQTVVDSFTTIQGRIKIGQNNQIHTSVLIYGITHIGDNNAFRHGCVIGVDNQDRKYAGEPTVTVVGNGNTFHEYITMHRGTEQDGATIELDGETFTGVTSVGDENWLMNYLHIGHDVKVGSNTIIANSTQLGGHAIIQNRAVLGACTAVHHFCHIGELALTGGGALITQDIPPYCTYSGGAMHGLNTLGLQRAGFAKETIRQLRNAYHAFYRSDVSNLDTRLENVEAIDCPEAKQFAEFIRDSNQSGLKHRRGVEQKAGKK